MAILVVFYTERGMDHFLWGRNFILSWKSTSLVASTLKGKGFEKNSWSGVYHKNNYTNEKVH